MNESGWKELRESVRTFYTDIWQSRDGQVIPEAGDIQHGNHAVKLEAAVLYADLAESTRLVSTQRFEIAGEVYKAYLHSCGKIIKSFGGKIMSYDGDRIMAMFIGGSKNTNAVKSAFYIHGAVRKIIQPEFESYYKGRYTWEIQHGIGIDSGVLHAARIGVRGHGNSDSDIVWIGHAANVAAKLANLREPGFSIYISQRVYNNMSDDVKLNLSKSYSPWEKRALPSLNLEIYRATNDYGRWPD